MRWLEVFVVPLGLVVGIGLVLLIQGGEAVIAEGERPPPSTGRPVAPKLAVGDDEDCASAVEEVQQTVHQLEQRLAIAKLIRSAQKARRAEREGIPQPWPDDVAPSLRSSAFEATVRSAANETGFRVLSMDCSEYPCVATIDKSEGLLVASGSSSKDLEVLIDALDVGDDVRAGPSRSALTREGRYVSSFALVDQNIDNAEGAERRLQWRLERAQKQVRP